MPRGVEFSIPRSDGMMFRYSVLVVLLFPASRLVAAEPIDFNRAVRPILSDKCFACHGPDEKARKAKLRLDIEKEAKAAGVIVPGKPTASALIARITASDEAERMPP